MTSTEDDAWSGERVARWIRQSAALERQLAPVSDVLFAAAGLRPGERVLDVGCGTGPTTRQAASLVGSTGHVTGLDVAAPMLEAAASTAVDPGAAPLAWQVADAVDWQPGDARFDVVLSRFGVMFFSDPLAAFRTLAGVGDRLTVAVWGRRDDSDLFRVPLEAARGSLAAQGISSIELPDDEGPFSLCSDDVVRSTLASAGWTDVEIAVHTLMLPFGGDLVPSEAAVVAMDFGPTRLVTADAGAPARLLVQAAIEDALQAHVDDAGHVVLSGRVHIVTARRQP